jgi:2-methylisocitrate lyase-like PEP mutase family enzyme
VAPKPVNVLMFGPGLTLAELADLGVRRVSIGGALARVAWGAMLKVAEEIKNGSFDGLGSGAPGKMLNGIFGEFGARPEH